MAGFNFGGSNPAPAPAPAASGGFSFGATPDPAAPAPAPAGGFSFGGASTPAATTATPAASTTAAATATASTGGFSFGGAPAAATGATAANPAPAPASTGGFSFGGATTTTPAAATAAAAPTTTPPAFSLTGTSASTTNTGAIVIGNASNESTGTDATMNIPQYETSFPNLSVHSHIESVLSTITNPSISSTDLTLQGQELVYLLSNQIYGQTLSKPSPISAKTASNATLRQRITTSPNPTILLPNQTSQTPIPKSLLTTILKISTLLNISEENAGALYGASIIHHLEQGRETLGDKTADWFEKRKILPCNGGEGFVGGVVNDHVSKGTYVDRDSQSNGMTDGDTDLEGKDEIHCAVDLYFLERGQVLETLRMLIQHRISASTNCANRDSTTDGHGNEYNNNEVVDLNYILLQATDQLLEEGLVSNLVQLVRDLTVQNEELAKKICLELDQIELKKQQGQGVNGIGIGTKNITPTTAPALGGFGSSFGFGGATAAVPAPAPVNPNKVTDADYAMYEFTFQQRQLACQCLFYLTYHTQCTMEETVALIDLIRDLTNGKTNGDGSSIIGPSLGSGLPILDPIRDVPDPYTVSWNQNGTLNNAMNMGMGGMAQQIKVEKRNDEWKRELFLSLWSVRGLSQATVTTSHADFSGQQLHHAMTLKHSANTGGIEAVEGGKPQLMQSVATLVLSAMCALDGNNILMDRQSHGPNRIGAGNTLVPSIDKISSVGQSIKPISDRVVSDSAEFAKWKRQDIAGLLSAAFALLLRPIANILASPAVESNSSSSALKALFRSSLEDPTIAKSITFARVSLIPCLGSASMKPSSSVLDNDFAFFMSILSDFTARYLDAVCSFGELPISRLKWMHDELQELQLRVVQEEQRKQLDEWSGKAYQKADLPTEVDISRRPDCLDDIIALAILLCSSCPQCSSRFWSITTSDDDDHEGLIHHLQPSRVMKKLEKLQAKDESLMHLYVSFLSVLALADNPNESPLTGGNGADAIYNWLSPNNRFELSPTSYDASKQVKWDYVLFSIQYYAQKLNPPAQKCRKSWGADTPSTNDEDNTSYYYGADIPSRFQSDSQKGSNLSSSDDVKKELDERSAMILSALLTLVSHVALKSEEGRKQILDIRLAPSENSNSGDDDAITILFSLLVTSISSVIRGLTLSAIANLIRQSEKYPMLSKEEKERSDDAILKCWNLLDLCQIVPIAKLGQYSPLQNGNNNVFSNNNAKKDRVSKEFALRRECVKFLNHTNKCFSQVNWFPCNEDYGIIYEMEYVEAKNGSYPSTEGLLKLLTALFSSSVLPVNLGREWRPQTGCTPYIEYVIDFVIPRTLHVRNSESGTYFATPADKSRLIVRALEVVDAVITRYTPTMRSLYSRASEPDLVSENSLYLENNAPIQSDQLATYTVKGKDLPDSSKHRSKELFKLVDSSIYAKEVNTQHIQHSQYDFINAPSQLRSGVSMESPMTDVQEKTIPKPKSPGYRVLVDVLSSNGSLFDFITQLLVDEFDSDTGSSHDSLVQSLFGEAMPSYRTAKAGRDYILTEHQRDVSQLGLRTLDSAFVELLMHPLVSEITEDVSETPLKENFRSTSTKGDTLVWREHSMLLSLRILCAAAARNDSFSACVNSDPGNPCIVPVMRFHPSATGLNNPLLLKNVQLSTLSKKILERSFDPSMNMRGDFFLTTLSQYVGYQSSSLKRENAIALAAMSLIKYMCDSTTPKDYVGCMCGLNPKGHTKTAVALSTRLSLISHLKDNDEEPLLCEEILDLILQNLVLGSTGNENLAHILLGLAGHTFDEQTQYLQKSLKGIDIGICHHRNALDSILDLVSDNDFILDPETSSLASKCYEIIYRLCDRQDYADPSWPITKLCVMNKLRKANFWKNELLRFLGSNPKSNSILRMTVSRSPIISAMITDSSNMPIMRRDSDVLHCVSWLLKGVALEIHSLMGAGDYSKFGNLVGKFPTSSPQPQKCRQLLQLLLSESSCYLLDTLVDIPLTKPLRLTEELLLKQPRSDAINKASYKMRGPEDISIGFTVVDVEKLCGELGNSNNTLELEAARIWAGAWNSYVSFVCSSSHITKSWSILTSTIFSSCREVLLVDHTLSEDSLSTSDISIILLRSILSRFCGKDDDGIGNDMFAESLDNGAIFTLSTTIIPIIDAILEMDHAGRMFASEEHLVQVIQLLVDAIVKCGNRNGIRDGLREEMAAVFAIALSALLESDLIQSNNFVQSLASEINFRNDAHNASVILAMLSCGEVSPENQNELLSVARAARSGLSSLLRWFDCIESNTDNEDGPCLLLDVFSSNSSTISLLSQIIGLIPSLDGDISVFLETIASCTHGTELLIRVDISEALVEASSKHAKDMVLRLQKHSYGSTEISYDEYLYGHLLLLTTMLSSNISELCLRRLLSDGAQMITHYGNTIEALFQRYPENDKLLFDFVTVIALISGSMRTIVGMDHLYQHFHSSVLSNLNNRIEDFALHICQYPFPISFLPLLPSQLTEGKMREGPNNINGCWWDIFWEKQIQSDSIILPAPPVDTFGTYKHSSQPWNLEGYEKAITAVKCANACLTYMIGRSSESSGPFQATRIISIAVALFRSFETTQVSSRRILKLIQIYYIHLMLLLFLIGNRRKIENGFELPARQHHFYVESNEFSDE